MAMTERAGLSEWEANREILARLNAEDPQWYEWDDLVLTGAVNEHRQALGLPKHPYAAEPFRRRTWGDVDWSQALDVMGAKTIPEAASVARAVQQARSGRGLDTRSLQVVDDFERRRFESELPQSLGHAIGTGVANLLPFSAEMGLTGGLASLGKSAVKSGVKRGLTKVGAEALERGMERALARSASEGVGAFAAKAGLRLGEVGVGAAARLPAMEPKYAAQAYLDSVGNESYGTEGTYGTEEAEGGFATSFLRNNLSALIEMGTEGMGEFFPGAARGARALAGKATLGFSENLLSRARQAVERLSPAAKARIDEGVARWAAGVSRGDRGRFLKALDDVRRGVKWDGFVSEWGEEDAGQLLSWMATQVGRATGIDALDLGVDEPVVYGSPGEMAVRGAVLAVPGAGFRGLELAGRALRGEKTQEETNRGRAPSGTLDAALARGEAVDLLAAAGGDGGIDTARGTHGTDETAGGRTAEELRAGEVLRARAERAHLDEVRAGLGLGPFVERGANRDERRALVEEGLTRSSADPVSEGIRGLARSLGRRPTINEVRGRFGIRSREEARGALRRALDPPSPEATAGEAGWEEHGRDTDGTRTDTDTPSPEATAGVLDGTKPADESEGEDDLLGEMRASTRYERAMEEDARRARAGDLFGGVFASPVRAPRTEQGALDLGFGEGKRQESKGKVLFREGTPVLLKNGKRMDLQSDVREGDELAGQIEGALGEQGDLFASRKPATSGTKTAGLMLMDEGAYRESLSRVAGKHLEGFEIEFVDQQDADARFRAGGGRLSEGARVNAFVDLANRRVVVSRLAEASSAADEAGHVLFAAHRALAKNGGRGLFSRAEIVAIEKRFGKLSAEDGVTQTAQHRANEQAFLEYVAGELAAGRMPQGFLKVAAKRIADFFRQLARALGWRELSARDVARRMLSGEVGRRGQPESIEANGSRASIYANGREPWRVPMAEAKAAAGRLWEQGQEADWRRRVLRAVVGGKYQKAIAAGEMSAEEAKALIDDAGVTTPEDIANMAPSEEPQLSQPARVRKAAGVRSAGGDFSEGLMAAEADAGEKDVRASLRWAGEQLANWRAGREIRDRDERPDLKVLDRALGTIFHYSNRVPALRRVFDAAVSMRGDQHELELAITDNPATGQSDVGAVRAFASSSREEWKRLEQYLWSKDRDAVGYRVKDESPASLDGKGEVGEGAGAEQRKFVLLSPSGKRLMEFEDEQEAWAAAYQREAEDLQAAGFSEAAAGALVAVRQINHRGFLQLRDTVSEMRRVLGNVIDDDKIRVGNDGDELTLAEAMSRMGDRRGYYMPRLRTGRFLLWAEKENENPRLEAFDTWAMRNLRAGELARQGWRVEKSQRQQSSEAVFGDVSLASLNDLLQNALERMEKPGSEGGASWDALGVEAQRVEYRLKNGKTEKHWVVTAPRDGAFSELLKSFGGRFYDDGQTGTGKAWHFARTPEEFGETLRSALAHRVFAESAMAREFQKSLVKQIAVQFQSRGSRSRKIARSEATGRDVFLGYEEDALKAVVLNAKSIAGGTAKRLFADRAMKAIMGADESWEEFRARWEKSEARADHGAEERGDKAAAWKAYQAQMKARRIDSATQPRAYKEAATFMREMLRNEEGSERVVGMIRFLAGLKYLSGVAPGLVNMTALATTVPGAMHALGNIPLKDAFVHLNHAAKDYATFVAHRRFGKGAGLTGEKARLFEEISKRGWDESQQNTEALAALRSKAGEQFARVVDLALLPMAVTERFNRASTIAAAFYGLRKQGMAFEEALTKAHEISNNAHGVYGKTNLPAWARGSGWGQVGRAAYMFATYPHNMLQLLAKIGWTDKKAAAWIILSPALIGGAGASIAAPVVKTLTKAVFAALGQQPPDDPEESFYAWLEAMAGAPAERFGRMGLAGLAGLNVKGSLSIGWNVPTTVVELLGAPASVVVDARDGAENLWKGNYLKAAEALTPRVVAGPLRAIREATEGVTSRSGQPVYWGNEPLRAGLYASVLRAAGLNPASVSEKRERQWSESRIERAYADRRKAIYERVREFALRPASKRNRLDWSEILELVEDYNARVERGGLGYVSLISRDSLRGVVREATRAPKRERVRAGAGRRETAKAGRGLSFKSLLPHREAV